MTGYNYIYDIFLIQMPIVIAGLTRNLREIPHQVRNDDNSYILNNLKKGIFYA